MENPNQCHVEGCKDPISYKGVTVCSIHLEELHAEDRREYYEELAAKDELRKDT